MSSRGDGSRTARIVVLLLVSLGATFLLAWQAQVAVTSHRAAAESVVRDYASLAADEFIRRVSAKVGYEGYYPLIGSLVRGLESTGDLDGSLPGPEDDRLRAALPLAKRYFLSVPGSDALAFEGAGIPSEEVRSWLRQHLKLPRDETSPYSVLHGNTPGEPITVVVREWTDGAGRKRVAGFEANLESLGLYVAQEVAEQSLLPPSLGNGEVTNAALSVSLVDHGGIERFQSGPDFPDFLVEASFGDAYGGVLEGSRVRLSVNPASASRLVIGGLPRSRLPFLGGLLVLTAVLVATAIREIRRERRLQRMRADFVANVSHELRTPLAQIRMFAETLLLGRVRSEEEATRSLRIIDREVRRLSHLVENVLQFSRGEREPFARARSREPIALAPRVDETIAMFRPLVAGTGTRIVTHLEPDAEAAIDPDALRQVLLNLLDNAAKYGPRGQEIVVGASSGNGTVRLVVEDQGPGIPEAERERVFDRFYRLAPESASAVAGTGIGLSVVRDLVAREGGRAYVETSPLGGARFVVELPEGVQG